MGHSEKYTDNTLHNQVKNAVEILSKDAVLKKEVYIKDSERGQYEKMMDGHKTRQYTSGVQTTLTV